MDQNQDGLVTLEDLEFKAIKYLCGGFQIRAPSGSPSKLQRKYTNSMKNSLSVAKRLFEKYQDPSDKTITEN